MSFRLSALASLALGAPLLAQEQTPDTARAAPVIVTATRLPLNAGALPVAVTVISGDELRVRGIATVADALTDVTSAYIAQSGSQGAQTSLFLRGGESKYVKVLIDGVPANDPGGVYDFASLTTDNVERIEIVRGPASVLYGADAVTGVVQIITRQGGGRGESQGTAEVRVGGAPRDRLYGGTQPEAMRTAYFAGGTSGALPNGSYSLTVARHQSDGLYQLNNEYRNNVLSGRFVFSPSTGTDVRASLRYTDYQFHYPTSGGGTPDSLGAFDHNANRSEDRTVLGVEVERALASSVRATLSLSSSVNDGGTDDQVDQPGGNSFVSQDKTRRRGAELRMQFLPGSVAAVTVGAQIEQQDQRSQTQAAFGTFPFNSLFSASRHNAGGYAELILTASRRLTATLGGRLDDNEQFGRFETGRAGLSWRPAVRTRVRATVGSAFREPTFAENYSTSAFAKGNPDLQPETSHSMDVGVDHDVGERVQLSLTGFAQRFRNMIDFTGSTATCGYSYCNVAAAESDGIEAEARARVTSALGASVGTAILRTRVVSPGFDTSSGGLYQQGESLIRRPSHTWNAEVSYRGPSRLSASARLLAVGKRADRDFRPFPATPVTLPAYRRVDLGAEYGFFARTGVRPTLTLRVENLTNAGYQSVFNYLAPRRTIQIGIRSRF